VLHAKLRNRTCQGLDKHGQGQGPSLQGQGQVFFNKMGKDKDLNLVLKESLRTRTRINITGWCTNVR